MRPVTILVFLVLVVATFQSRLVKRQINDKRIVCYYTSWSRNRQGAEYSPSYIDPHLCTHILYAFMGIDLTNVTIKSIDGQTFKDIPEGNFKEFTDLKNVNPDLMLMFSLGGWNYASKDFSQLAANEDLRRRFVKNAVQFIRTHGFDGLDLCWQYPAFRENSSSQDKENYAQLIKELREELEADARRSGLPRLTMSVVMSAFPEIIEQGFDIPTINNYVDFINMIGYDYYQSTGLVINHHAALYPLIDYIDDPLESQLNVDASITYMLKQGLKPKRINMGIPTYGRFYKLSDPKMTTPGSEAEGEGVGSTTANKEPGFKAYYEICMVVKDWTVVRINETAMGPYAYKDTDWISYDDQGSIQRKAEYAIKKKLGGLMFWTIDDDDYEGNCGDGRYPLISAAGKAFRDGPIVYVDRSDSAPPAVPAEAPPSRVPAVVAPPKVPAVAAPPTVPEVAAPPRVPMVAGEGRAAGDAVSDNFPTSNFQDFQNFPFDALKGLTGGDVSLSRPSLSDGRGTNILFPNNVYFQDIKSWVINHFHFYDRKN